MVLTKIFNGKRYKYYNSHASKLQASKNAKFMRKKGFNARVVKDPREFASTYHLYIRKA